MANITATRGETTYDITGLTTRQAAIIFALIGRSSDKGLYDIYSSLDVELQKDPTYKRRRVVDDHDAWALVSFHTVEEDQI